MPFCQQKCYYCDFFSGKFNDDIKNQYVDALIAEIKAVGEKSQGKMIDTIYFGGGTPTFLDELQIEKIVSTIYKSFHIDLKEFTVETNPNIESNFELFKSFGINRISIGVQSLDDALLKKIGRTHTAEQAKECIIKAKKYFENVSADLILGIDDNQNVVDDLDFILKHATHISTYILTVADKTPLKAMLKNKTVAIATENNVIKQYETVYDTCKKFGFDRYEVSNFALPGFESKHNRSYWDLTDYYGFGPAAYSYADGVRYYNMPNLKRYLSGENSGTGKQIIERGKSIEEDKNEFVMLSLRTDSGLNLADYYRYFHEDFLQKYKESVLRMSEFLDISSEAIRIKKEFFLVQNSIISEII